ncbi:hypothetical protein QM543_07245 [Pantoea eucrina]|uniref:hypothetical protein n=1 Tax=Pantoea eucrina TaxID=472693 RepID=UPI0014289541|nr:hypothetical protein [Pantoea eucrina]MDJ0023076.1 hypothetical protein [Pantoea eucrina]
MQHDDDVWGDFMQGMLGELADPMTYEQAAQEAIADFRTERQFEAMGGCHE